MHKPSFLSLAIYLYGTIFFFLIETCLLRGCMFLVKPFVCHPLQYRNYFTGKQFHFSVVESRIKTYHSVSNAMLVTLSQL